MLLMVSCIDARTEVCRHAVASIISGAAMACGKQCTSLLCGSYAETYRPVMLSHQIQAWQLNSLSFMVIINASW